MESLYNRLYEHFVAEPNSSNKLPRIFLDYQSQAQDPLIVDVYLVNSSPVLFDWVRVDRGYIEPERNGYSDDNKLYIDYEDVLPREAVLVATFDEMFHCDFLNQLRFTVKERGKEPLDFDIVEKGVRRLLYRVLDWKTEGDRMREEDLVANELTAAKVVETRKQLEIFYRYGPGITKLLSRAEHVGCFYCIAQFTGNEYRQKRDESLVEFCPSCGIDALVPEGLGLNLDDETLKLARHMQFNGYADEEGYQIPWL